MKLFGLMISGRTYKKSDWQLIKIADPEELRASPTYVQRGHLPRSRINDGKRVTLKLPTAAQQLKQEPEHEIYRIIVGGVSAGPVII